MKRFILVCVGMVAGVLLFNIGNAHAATCTLTLSGTSPTVSATVRGSHTFKQGGNVFPAAVTLEIDWGDGGAVAWLGDGTSVFQRTKSFTYPQNGTYDIIAYCTFDDGAGNGFMIPSNPATFVVDTYGTVNDCSGANPPPTCGAGGPTPWWVRFESDLTYTNSPWGTHAYYGVGCPNDGPYGCAGQVGVDANRDGSHTSWADCKNGACAGGSYWTVDTRGWNLNTTCTITDQVDGRFNNQGVMTFMRTMPPPTEQKFWFTLNCTYTPPEAVTLDNVTISSPTVKADNTTQYIIAVTSSDNQGGTKITHQYALINYQGENVGAYRGYLTMYYPSNPGWSGEKACTGGGWGAIQPGFGNTYIKLDSCVVSTVGNARTTTYTVRFDPTFTTPLIDNDISGYTCATALCQGWTNFQTNFNLVVPDAAPTVSNVKVTEPDYCTVGPSINVSWTYSDPDNGGGADPQSKYQVKIYKGGATVYDSGVLNGVTTAYSVPNGSLTWGTNYNAKVQVWDTKGPLGSSEVQQTLCQGPPGNPSGCSGDQKSWKSPQNQYPNNISTWTFTPNHPAMNQVVTFGAGSTTCYKTPPNTVDNCSRWDWTFGDGATVNAQNTTHTYTAYGNYTVTLKATDSLNGYACSNSKVVSVQKPVPNWKEVLPQ